MQATRGFPNMFWLNGPQGIITNSATFALDEISTHIAHITAKMRQEGRALIEPSESAEAQYCDAVFEASTKARKFYASCTPGYYSNEGVVDTETKSLAANFPGGQPGGASAPRCMLRWAVLCCAALHAALCCAALRCAVLF